MDNTSIKSPSTSMAYMAYKSKLHSVLRSSMHPCPDNWVTIGRANVYHAGVVHAFSAGIKCQHCSIPSLALFSHATMIRISSHQFKLNLRSVLRASMHPFPEKWVAISHVAVYHASLVHAFSAGIKCKHCSISSLTLFAHAINTD